MTKPSRVATAASLKVTAAPSSKRDPCSRMGEKSKVKTPPWRHSRTHKSERNEDGATGVIAKGKVCLFQKLGRHIDLVELFVDRIQFAVFGIDADPLVQLGMQGLFAFLDAHGDWELFDDQFGFE